MIKDVQLRTDLEAVQQDPQKDAACKKLLSHKVFLAWILKTCLAEYKECSVEDIVEKYIEGEPWIDEISVDSDETNPSVAVSRDNPVIKGENNEDTSLTEGKTIYDILFYAVKPGAFNKDKEHIRLLINIEPQNNWNTPYPIMKRAVYYTSRLISSQKGRDFFDTDYDKISKAASIWICLDTPKYLQNTITCYEMNEHNLIGNVKMPKEDYDLQTIALVCPGQSDEANYGGLLELLEVLLSAKLEVEEKETLLKDKFDIVMTDEMKKEAKIMGSYGLGMLEQGKREGISIGIERGIAQGIAQGRAEGKAEGRAEATFQTTLANIQSLITTLGLSAEKAMDALNIPQEERSQYLPKLKHLN